MEGATETSSASAGATAPSAAAATASAPVTVSGSSAVVVIPNPGGATSVAASSVVSTSSSSGQASPTTVIGPPAANVTVDTSVAAAAMCVLHDAGRINAGTEGSSSGSGSNPHSPLTMDDDRQRRRDRSNENGRNRTWRRIIHRELRDELINAMLQELQRITGQQNVRHLRMCASRYESFVWRKSDNQIQYLQKLERRIQSLRRQPSQCEQLHSAHMESAQALLESAQAQLQRLQRRQQEVRLNHPPSTHCHHTSCRHPHRSMSNRRSRRHSSSHRASSVSSPSRSPCSTASGHASRDERYFRRLQLMKIKYRDEVALVFRELCRVNTVIQHSTSLRRHESNNLGDFLANLKKIIYLLEQQPDEMNGMIPARKRTIEYLDVVESHIQRKVLPILYRLRHTYSTILRPIVLNYLKNSARFSRRL